MHIIFSKKAVVKQLLYFILAMAALPSEQSKSSSSTSTAIRDFCTVLALSFHAVFEGLAVGLEKSIEDVWTLFAAVATHKFVISFCVGIELVSVGTPMPFFLTYIIVYAVMTPIGIGIGIAVTELADSDNIAYAAATGTLQGNIFHFHKYFYLGTCFMCSQLLRLDV